MQRCLDLAQLGRGSTQTNPMVGCVIVHQGQIIAEGYHQAFGQAHAEVLAFNEVKDKSVLKECDVFVNLEPCSFHGKTPACASLFESYPVNRLIVGMLDPNPKVAGKGIDRVKKTGSQIVHPILEAACRRLNSAFTKSIETKQPYTLAKWAQSSDGFIGSTDKRISISNDLVNTVTQKWRSEIDAYLIGNITLKLDQPQLDARLFEGNQPLRCVIGDSIDPENPFFKVPSNGIVFSERDIPGLPHHFKQVHTRKLQSILKLLYEENVGTLMIEGGTHTLNSFLQKGLVDELRVITNHALQLKQGISAPVIPESFILQQREMLRDNTISYYRKKV